MWNGESSGGQLATKNLRQLRDTEGGEKQSSSGKGPPVDYIIVNGHS